MRIGEQDKKEIESHENSLLKAVRKQGIKLVL